jgi:hypothetical protein
MIKKTTRHENCEIHIIVGYSLNHHAHLECCDPKCKRDKKFIQWLGHRDHEYLVKIGIPVKHSEVVKVGNHLYKTKGLFE